MNEKKLISAAQNGDVSAMMELVRYYDEKSEGGGIADEVGDVIATEDFFKALDDAENNNDSNAEEYKAEAYRYCLMAAEAGDAEAMTEVGRRLYDGIGVKKDNEGSKVWYRRGAEAGNPHAMRVVAFTSDDEKEKFKWYKLSAELLEDGLNKQDSIKETAINYACGRGTDKNETAANEWLERLDEDRKASAMMEIARITGDNTWLERASEFDPMAMIRLAEEFTLKDDFANALIYYEKAADAGSADAMSIIGDIFYIGENGVEQSYKKAFEWYDRAAKCNEGNMAKIKRALLIYRGSGGVRQHLQHALRQFDKISWTQEDFGLFSPLRFNSVARYYGAKMTEAGEGCRKNLYEAFERYSLAGGVKIVADYESPHRIAHALYKVAEAYFLGRGTKQNFSKALKFYEKTFEDGEGDTYKLEAAKKIMWMYELGEGIPQNKEKAAEWRSKIEKLESTAD